MPLLVLVVSGSKGSSTMTLASGWGSANSARKCTREPSNVEFARASARHLKNDVEGRISECG